MASPQVENGYSKIANEILEQIYKLKLNGSQFRIILVIWRYTYGFSRKEHELSEGYIAKAANLNRKQVSRELRELIGYKIVVVVKESTPITSRTIAFNKHYDRWELFSGQGTNQYTGSELAPRGGVGLVDLGGSFLDPQDNKVLKKYIKQSTNDAEITRFNVFWHEYPKHVAKAAAQKSFSKLKVNDESLSLMISALEKQKQSKQWQDKQFIPYPATWLNQQRWMDEAEESQSGVKVVSAGNGSFKLE